MRGFKKVFLLLSILWTSQAFGFKAKIGLLPIVESLPVYVAKEKGYFPSGFEVEIVRVGSAAERDQLLASGKIDIVINDLLAVALFNAKGTRVLVIGTSAKAVKGSPMFFLLSSPKSGISKLEQLKGIPIAVSENTLPHYVTERILELNGFKPSEMSFLPIPRIPDRMSALVSDRVKAAVLPDPLAFLALKEGCNLILEDSQYDYSVDVFSARKEFLERYPQANSIFLSAVYRAVNEIYANKDWAKEMLVEKKLLPPSLKDTYKVPDYLCNSFSLPSPHQWQEVLEWLKKKRLLEDHIPYERVFYRSKGS
jgi:NitT/TauT family transport system substrate-binding protein